MKKRILCFLTFVALILGIAGVLTACGETGEEYSVTVLTPAREAVEGVTVSWNSSSGTEGSAVTDENGKATATLPLGSYDIVLSDLGDGYEYTKVSASPTTRNLTIRLKAVQVNYSVTVTNSVKPAEVSNITVTWENEDGSVSVEETTNASGQASHTLDHGTYYVSLSNLPAGTSYGGAETVTGANPDASFTLTEQTGTSDSYTVTVMSAGGLLFKNQAVRLYKGGRLVERKYTNDQGVCTFDAAKGDYTAKVASVPAGYTATEATLTETIMSATIIMTSSVVTDEPESNTRYVIGDIIHDYTFTTPYKMNGEVYSKSISEMLKTKKAVLINNWGVNCSWCMTEMPTMAAAYDLYKDDIEMIAVNNFSGRPDSDSVIISTYESSITESDPDGYGFPMMRDTNNFASKFALSGWPTTIVIDRYGAIAHVESGAILDVETWGRLIERYIGDDYKQTFTPGETPPPITSEREKPDIVLDPDHYENIGKTINDTNLFPVGASVEWYPYPKGQEESHEYAWPFILGVEEDLGSDTVMYCSNINKANSWAIIYARVNVPAGHVFTFDYYSQTEDDDVLSILWDGKIVKEIYGTTDAWTTCYLYTDLLDGEHTLSMAYIKDSSGNVGKDTVFMKNVRFVNINDIQGEVNMLRSAAYGVPASNAAEYPYYADVALGDDGYYHVNLNGLQNSSYAGNDESPLLLANLMGVTQWNANYSINVLSSGINADTGEYVVDCNFTINGVTKDYRSDIIAYASAAAASDIAGFVPVNQELHDLLVAFMKAVSGNASHAREWLEVCYFYSHYGEGDLIGNPILGLMPQTAIPLTEGELTTADLTRNMFPFPTMIYSFVPEKNAVYKLESFIPKSLSASKMAQVILYDDETDENNYLAYCGDRIVRGGENEHNFELYYYMTAGHKYYIEVAYLMLETGSYDFKIEKIDPTGQNDQEYTQLERASGDTYSMVLDEQGNFNGEIFLEGAVECKLGNDGYYHAVNPDGTLGSIIYIDLKYASTTALGTIPIMTLVNRYVRDPADGTNLDYLFFDFRYRVTFYSRETTDGTVTDYNPKTDFTSLNAEYGWERYKDYTDTVKGWVEQAEATDGLLAVTQEVVDVMSLYIEMRVNAMMDGETDTVLSNEWLRFCWYYKTYSSTGVFNGNS